MRDISENKSILFVDDEIFILASIERQLYDEYDIVTAKSGMEALEVLSEENEIAVIVSDMRMPNMDGIELLKRVSEKYPHIIRIMLTGNKQKEVAIEAVNNGNIFRFLEKPTEIKVLRQVIDSALKQYKLANAEKVLLEQTLNASLGVMLDILEMTNPYAFRHTKRVQKVAVALAEELGLDDIWIVNTAAMLAQIGTIAIPVEILMKINEGKSLSVEEKKLYESHPQIAYDLIKKIPRLERVANAILNQQKNFRTMNMKIEDDNAFSLCVGAILRVSNDYQVLKSRGFNHEDIIEEMKYNDSAYNSILIQILERKANEFTFVKKVYEIKIRDLVEGMIIEEDIESNSGALVVRKGHTVSTPLIHMMQSMSIQKNIKDKVLISVPEFETE